MPRHTPDHHENAKHLATLRELVRIAQQIAELQEERRTLVKDLPCGFYTVPNEGRWRVEITASANISPRLLRLYVSDETIRRCRVRGPYRKRIRPADLKPETVAREEAREARIWRELTDETGGQP